MTEAHLSDRELQLAAEAYPLPAAAAIHLRECPGCQTQLASYQRLFAATARLPKPAFEFDLATAVLVRLPRAKPAFPWILVLVAVPVLGVIAAFLALFGNLFVQAFQGLFATLLGTSLVALTGFIVGGQCLALWVRYRRQVQLLTLL